MARAAAALFEQFNALDRDAALESFDHVVNGQRRDRDGRHRFHLDAGRPVDRGTGSQGDGSGLGIDHAIYFEMVKPERVAERNQFSGPFGGHDPCDPRAGEHVTLRRIAGRYGQPYDHHAIRALASAAIPGDALVIAYDTVPAALLYRLGRNGWWIDGRDGLDQLPGLAARGARFVVARGERRAHLTGVVGELVGESDGVGVYRLDR